MLRRSLALAGAVTIGLLAVTGQAQAQQARAQAAPRPRPAVRLPGVRVVDLHRAYQARLRHRRPAPEAQGLYALGRQPKGGTAAPKVRPAKSAAACVEPACPVAYNNGPVQHTPHVYLVLWGPGWSTTGENAAATYLMAFYTGLGNQQAGTGSQQGDIWSGITSQYGDSSGNPAFTGPVLAATIKDTSTPPTGATQAQIAAEADTVAASQGITDLADAQIVVATQSGACQQGFADPSCGSETGPFCAWRGFSGEAYISLPFLPDAGRSCGEDFTNTGGTYDGFSLIGGDLYANAITDPQGPAATPDPAWVDAADTVSGGEVAGKCAFGQSFSAGAPATDMALLVSPGVVQPFAMQSLWSNSANGCVMSAVAKDSLTLTSPGSLASTTGDSVSLQLQATSSGSYLITWHASNLPAGLTLSSTTGVITGTPNTSGTYGVTIAAVDETGASRSASFNWTVNPASGRITGPHGKCLDDAGASTANGNKIDIWTCNGTKAQQWTFTAGGALMVLGKCLDDLSQTGAGTKLVLFTCTGHKAQTWSRSSGEYVLKLNGLCLTDPSSSQVNGTQVQIRACRNFIDQHWSLPK